MIKLIKKIAVDCLYLGFNFGNEAVYNTPAMQAE